MRPRGFTLVEIMVVVVIVATLASIVYVLGSRMVTRARIAQSSSNLRTLVTANQGYHADHRTYCPADNQSNTLRWHGRRTSAQAGFDSTRGLLSPYLGQSRKVMVCPLFEELVPNEVSFESGTGGYGYNAAYIGGKPGSPWDRSTRLRIPERMANILDASRTVMFTTTAYARAGGLQEYPYCEPPFWDFGGGPSGMRPSPSVHFRANGKAIVAWCDGHVTLEASNREEQHGANPHGGDSHDHDLGWFGSEENNGAWNPQK
ncbi:MAG: prepilin-type N-terminal cleavage/methylation domain-containing protein [Verrucomicrobiota bacterium]